MVLCTDYVLVLLNIFFIHQIIYQKSLIQLPKFYLNRRQSLNHAEESNSNVLGAQSSPTSQFTSQSSLPHNSDIDRSLPRCSNTERTHSPLPSSSSPSQQCSSVRQSPGFGRSSATPDPLATSPERIQGTPDPLAPSTDPLATTPDPSGLVPGSSQCNSANENSSLNPGIEISKQDSIDDDKSSLYDHNKYLQQEDSQAREFYREKNSDFQEQDNHRLPNFPSQESQRFPFENSEQRPYQQNSPNPSHSDIHNKPYSQQTSLQQESPRHSSNSEHNLSSAGSLLQNHRNSPFMHRGSPQVSDTSQHMHGSPHIHQDYHHPHQNSPHIPLNPLGYSTGRSIDSPLSHGSPATKDSSSGGNQADSRFPPEFHPHHRQHPAHLQDSSSPHRPYSDNMQMKDSPHNAMHESDQFHLHHHQQQHKSQPQQHQGGGHDGYWNIHLDALRLAETISSWAAYILFRVFVVSIIEFIVVFYMYVNVACFSLLVFLKKYIRLTVRIMCLCEIMCCFLVVAKRAASVRRHELQ